MGGGVAGLWAGVGGAVGVVDAGDGGVVSRGGRGTWGGRRMLEVREGLLSGERALISVGTALWDLFSRILALGSRLASTC